MSEFSESYHIRTSDPAATTRRIREARFWGLVFPPTSGWLTFVPYADRKEAHPLTGAEAHRLPSALKTLVLVYVYAEDHGWFFRLHQPGKPLVAYECWWDPELAIDRSQFDLRAVEPLLLRIEHRSELEKLLNPSTIDDIYDSNPARRFAELLGLPEYRWLSPAYVQEEPDSYLKKGAKKIGRRPPKPEDAVQLPPARSLDLHRPDLSAREAFEKVQELMRLYVPTWLPTKVLSQGPPLKDDGRLTDKAPWDVWYRQKSVGGYVSVTVWSHGRIRARFHPFGYVTLPGLPKPEAPVMLPDEWVDSPIIASTILADPTYAELGPHTGFHMCLQLVDGERFCWHVTRDWGLPSRDRERIRVSYLLDAGSGVILAEQYQRSVGSEVVEARQTVR